MGPESHKGALESNQWIQRWFKSREGSLYIQTMKNHLGAVMRIWRVGRTGRNTILIPSEGMKGWKALLQALQREPQMQVTDTKTSTQETYKGQKETQTIAHPLQKAHTAPSRSEEIPAEWKLAMVIVRSAPIHPWSMIGYMLGAGLQRGVTLHPFGADKALFYCVSSQEKENMISQGKKGLPINLWNMPTYQSIGSHFGGLVEVVSTTERKAYEQGAWIRVAGDINRFFPGQIEVPCWGTKVTITILTSVSGNKNGEDEANVGPKADVADLEKLQQGGIAEKEDGMEPAISAAAGVSTGDTTANEQGVRTAPNGSKDGGHQNAINTGDVDLVSISRNSNTHQDKGKGKEILIHPAQHETYSIMGTTRLLKGLVLDGDLGSDSSQEGQTPTIARLMDIRHVQDRAREDIIQDLQRGRLALSQGQIQGGDTPHSVRTSKSLVIRQHDSSPTVSEDSVHNGSKSDDSTSDGESSPNEYVQDSLDYGEYEDPELDFDQYELTGVTPGPQDNATTEPKDQSYTDTVLEISDEAILTHLFAQPLQVDAVAA
ncbi:hypothetical protein Syun_011055 [Stephania yunnanensis]|uniref:Uncharacterized protein n=1 Tax=Stephania yunnanensis TaxID=152371 RepID=A0AAP0PHV2_9MAGN